MLSTKYLFPSEDWVKALCQWLNNDVGFLEGVRGWNIDVLFVAKDLPTNLVNFLRSRYGVDSINEVGVWIRLRDKCDDARFIVNPKEDEFKYVVKARYETWLAIINGLNDPISTMVKSLKDLEVRGTMITLVRLAANVLSPMARVIMRMPMEIIK
ncbi:hypothetical protein [Vulcanisaeta thermophila]|uniref:hypothetical protein n=1 Tax=Vulcanisaeta thermophila TaxID=867917 RepID=UPI000853ED45|nr:hypothetical protein [Vulcanisaeta thermophila]